MASNDRNGDFVYIGAAGEGGSAGHGLYRMKADGGEWAELTNGLPVDPEVRAIALHPDDSRVVFAGTDDGVYRSDDRGDHWERLALPATDDPVWSLLFQPGDPKVMFVGYASAEIHRSDDGGESWRPLRIEVEFPAVTDTPNTPKRIIGMSANSSRPDDMYAAIEVGGLIRSLDGGESWEGVTGGLYVNDDSVDVHGVVASAAEPDTVLIITRIGMFQSTDRGEHWRHVDLEKLGPIGTYCRCLREAPDDPRTLYLTAGPSFNGNSGALYKSRDVGRSWERIDLGHTPQSTLFGVAINAAQPSQMYCCTADGEVFGSQDSGGSWMAYPLPEKARELRAIACG